MFKEPIFENTKEEKRAGNEILSSFSPEQQEEIEKKRKILSSLAFFVGKDFEIPVELNAPGEGWHWDFKNNIIRIDPQDLLEKPMDYLRFVICHEGGHRRISRTDFIPLNTWKQPGFSFMMNSIEDPRDNNFLAESYHKFTEQMEVGYEWIREMEEKIDLKAKQELGYIPRFKQAGYEYIRMWYKEEMGEDAELREDLPDDVKEVVKKTYKSARNSWLTFPTKEMADGFEVDEDGLTGEDSIVNHAKFSYEINLKEIWPEFEKLLKKDMEDQKMQEFMKDMHQEKGEGEESPRIPEEFKDKLSEEEKKELEEQIKKTLERAKEKENKESEGATPIDIDSLSDGLKQKIKEHIDSLPDEKKDELTKKAEEAIKDFEKELNEELEGKLADTPEKQDGREEHDEENDFEDLGEADDDKKDDNNSSDEKTDFSQKDDDEFRKSLDNIFSEKKEDEYNNALQEIAPMIDNLSGELRDIFIKRKQQSNEAEYRSGKKWNVKKRVKEIISGIPLFKSEAREQKNIESEEKDYALTLMVDLSGSMRQGGKIKEAFKSVVLLAETLNDLGIMFEIVGFQDVLIEFKKFDNDFNDEMRERLNQILLEVNNDNPGGNNTCEDNNDGECLLAASDHLEKQMGTNKFLMVLSDGAPAMDSGRKSSAQLDKELKEAVKQIKINTEQKLIGIGLLSGAVEKYYENNMPNVSVNDLSETLGGVLREIIENY